MPPLPVFVPETVDRLYFQANLERTASIPVLPIKAIFKQNDVRSVRSATAPRDTTLWPARHNLFGDQYFVSKIRGKPVIISLGTQLAIVSRIACPRPPFKPSAETLQRRTVDILIYMYDAKLCFSSSGSGTGDILLLSLRAGHVTRNGRRGPVQGSACFNGGYVLPFCLAGLM